MTDDIKATDLIDIPVPIIGLVGLAGSGKDTVANMICCTSDVPHATVVSYAGPLKQMARHVIEPFVGENAAIKALYGPSEQRNLAIPELGGVTVRYILQTLGTEWGRDTVHKKLWTKLGLARSLEHIRSGLMVIVTDARFLTEMRAIKKVGGEVWRIERPSVGTLSTHASEVEMQFPEARALADVTIVNNGTLTDLRATVEAVARRRLT